MKLPLLTSSSFSSSWLSPTIIDATDSSSSPRVLHLAPSRQLNDAWYISLIQEAKTWDGDLCLHLQPHPIPWIFVVHNNDDPGDDNNEYNEPVAAAAAASPMPTSLQVSKVVWSELLGLLQSLPEQGRGLHLILEKDFIPNLMLLKHLLTVAAPSLIRIETNHPCLLPDLLPQMATMCPNLRTLIMDAPATFSRVHHSNPLVALTSLLSDSFCQLMGLHLHFSLTTRQQLATRKQQLLHMQNVFATLATCLHNRRTLNALKISGGNLDSILKALLSYDWPSSKPFSLHGSLSLKKLEIESHHWQLGVVQNHDGTWALDNSHKSDLSSSSNMTLSHFFHSTLVASLTHLTIRLKDIKIQTLPSTQVESTLPKPSMPTILRDAIMISSLTHLTLQAGLTTSMVDTFLIQLQDGTPQLQELDLEGNDMESLELPKFLAMDHSKQTRFPNLQKLFLGSNLFTYSTQMDWVERLLHACPRLDVGHRGMPSCGILDHDDNHEYDYGLYSCGRNRMKRFLFTSWAHATPLALAWKDWNEHGRHLILLQHSSLVHCGGGLWPLVLEQITKHFHDQPSRQATVLYLFLQSGAIPYLGDCATSSL